MSMDCQRGCEHGGLCELTIGHRGDHKAGPCTFTDAESVSREEADAILSQTTTGQLIATVQRKIESALDLLEASDTKGRVN